MKWEDRFFGATDAEIDWMVKEYKQNQQHGVADFHKIATDVVGKPTGRTTIDSITQAAGIMKKLAGLSSPKHNGCFMEFSDGGWFDGPYGVTIKGGYMILDEHRQYQKIYAFSELEVIAFDQEPTLDLMILHHGESPLAVAGPRIGLSGANLDPEETLFAGNEEAGMVAIWPLGSFLNNRDLAYMNDVRGNTAKYGPNSRIVKYLDGKGVK